MGRGMRESEQEYWKNRFRQMIDAKVEQILDEYDPFMNILTAKAGVKAENELGCTKALKDITILKEQLAVLEKRIAESEKALYEALTGRDGDAGYATSRWTAVQNVVRQRRDVILARLMAKHPVGKQVLKLQNEKDHVMDAIMMATGGIEIRKLFVKVSETLGVDMTDLQKESLNL
jgi:hypothetical protein